MGFTCDRRSFLASAGFSLMPASLGATGRASGGSPGPASDDPSRELHALFAAEWDYDLEHDPVHASSLGDRRWNNRWPDVSLDAIARDHQHRVWVLEKLHRIERAGLSAADQLNYDLFGEIYQTDVEGDQFHWYLIPLNQREGIQTTDSLAQELRFETAKDYEDWLGRLRAFPRYVDQTMALMQEGIRERMLLPRVVMERITAQVDKHLVAKPEESGYYAPFRNFPAAIPEAERARLSQEARDAIQSQVIPAFQRFRKFFVEQYLPACFEQVGIWQNPRGAEMYAYFVRRYTTTNMTPDQVHELGLKEVARIRAEMQGVMEKTGFRGTREQFFEYLRTDARFHYESPETLLMAYRATAKRIDPELIKVFGKLPRQPYGVEPIPAVEAPDTTTAYYRVGAADGSRAGTYMVNLYKPELRPKWEMMPLTLHEAVPGHHLQIALGMELENLPNFRRYGYFNAFGEGWGLYAESLGETMGLYDDPYSKFGQLTYDMWRAVRLVIDTGMHAQRWSRERAINYFMDNAPKEKIDIVNEVDRYIVWPGQALCYKIGQLKFRELRERARRELDSRFDLRAFHDQVLSEGTLPLDLLERLTDAWIASQKTRA